MRYINYMIKPSDGQENFEKHAKKLPHSKGFSFLRQFFDFSKKLKFVIQRAVSDNLERRADLLIHLIG